MRGADVRSGELFSYVDLEQRVPARHPLRAIRLIVNEALADIGTEFEAIYSSTAGPLSRRRTCFARCCSSFFTASARSDR